MTPEEFKKELDELKMEIVSSDDLEKQIGSDVKGIAVEIDIDTEVDYTDFLFHNSDYIVKLKTCRNDELYLMFSKYDKLSTRLTMTLTQVIEDKYLRFYKECDKKIGTTFPDICWYHSEGTTSENKIEVETEFREKNATFGDITWVLPTRFIDNIIETITLINQSDKFFGGLLRDSIIYGPYFLD